MSITLQTTTGELIRAGGGPYQLTRDGRRSLPTSSQPLSRMVGGGHINLVGGGTISFSRLYETQPWVAAVVNKLNRQISRIPLKVYEHNSQGDRERVRDGRLVELLRNPMPRRGPVHLKQSLTFPVLLHGNAVVAKARRERGGPPTSLLPLRWPYLQEHVLEEGGPVDHWETSQFGGRGFVDASECIHVAWDAPDGNLGISPLMQLGITLLIEAAAQQAQAGFHEHGWRSSAIVTFPADADIDDDDLDDLDAEIKNTFGGSINAGAVALLTGGADVKTFSFNAQEAELVNQRRLTREEVCGVYDIPPPLVGILDKATYSNIDTQHSMLFTDVLGPWMTLIEETIQAQLIDGEPEFEGLFVEFDPTEVLRGDPLAEIQAIREAIATGVLTPLEGRRILNRPAKGQPGEDDLYLPQNNLRRLGAGDDGDGDPAGAGA